MTFDEAFHELLGHEGGYSDHPDDPGGETMWGVTEAVAKANGYYGPMKDLPVDFAKAIYKKDYWDKVRADAMPEFIRYALFDAAVNSGPEQAIQWLQRTVGETVDGKLGPKTLAAVAKADPEAVEARMLGYRLLFMTDLKNWRSFNRGWAKRIAQLLIEW
jgi:lysozyme family protein